MADNYATVQDVILLYRPLSPEEMTKAENLIPIICDRLRECAYETGRDLDQMITAREYLANVAKSVVVDVVARNLQTPTEGPPMTQFSEAGNGYSASGTFLVPGGGIFIKNGELKALGLSRPRYGVIEFYSEGGQDESDQ